MEKYNITGMSCAACQSRVETAVSKIDGVKECSVSLLTNSMGVTGDVPPEIIIKAVEEAGYGASLQLNSSVGENKSGNASSNNTISALEDSLKDRETPKIKKRLLTSLAFLIVLMYFSMGHMMFSFKVPEFFEGNHLALGLVQMTLSAIIMVINQKFFINGFKGLIHRSPNMDTLVALGSSVSFLWSLYELFLMTAADEKSMMELMNNLYFESAAMILVLISLGKLLESISKGKTTSALKNLMSLSPKTATVIIDNAEEVVPIEKVKVGDIFVVRPGESIPVDGEIIEGESAVDEAALSGESIPVDKVAGDTVSQATINTSGFIKCRATRVGEDTTLSQIIAMVSDAAATKAPIAKVADTVSGVFVPIVICISVVTMLVWLLLGEEFAYALSRGISVLVISCPCALGLATPVAIMVGNGMGAKHGILFKTSASLEQAGKTQIVVLDKTGTITEGKPVVTDVISCDGESDEELICTAYAIEIKSEHPLAKAVNEYAVSKNIKLQEIDDFKAHAGSGVSGKIAGVEVFGGNEEFIEKSVKLSGKIKETGKKLSEEGKTPLYFCKTDKLLGIIAVADVVKSDSKEAIAKLKNMGISVVMLTGDNERTAKVIGNQVGVQHVVANVRPDGKEEIIRKLMEVGKVAMVGDGINDAPALTRADTGIAIGAGTDVAIDAAEVVIVKNSLLDVVRLIMLSRATLKNIYENLFWAFIYNIIGIPLAAGCFIKLFGLTLSPMFGAAAMSLSSFCVVSNALRLNLFDMNRERKNKSLKQIDLSAVLEVNTNNSGICDKIDIKDSSNEEEENKMTKTVKIEGMMCKHCEAHMKEALEAIDGVESAVTSHEAANAVITCSVDVSEDAIIEAVKKAGYEYKGIEE